MPMKLTNRQILDRRDPIELVLELLSFAGGENTIGEDHELKSNEARIIENWDAISLGGMERSKGFSKVADGSGGGYTDGLDLLIQHNEAGSTRTYAIVEGDLVYKNGAALTQDDDDDFTSGILSHAVSAGDKLWITNPSDNLQYKTIAGDVTVPDSVPDAARERIYYHKFRLIAEGGGKVIYGSRAASGNWTEADAWSLANDAWNMTMPEDTKGMVMGFPSGDEATVFTEYGAYALYNFPDTAYRPLLGVPGCSAPYALAKGKEGVFIVSKYPVLGVFLWNGVNYVNLTEHHDFVNDINFSGRIFGEYRNQKYYLMYNDAAGNTPNTLRIYDTKFGRWMKRSSTEKMGYPALLKYSNNELYIGSSDEDELYELEDTSNADNGSNTSANYKTKDFSSADFNVASGGKFPIDEVRIKLTKIIVTCYGTTGAITILWTADKGRRSGSQTIDIADTQAGARINDDFTVNTSYIVEKPSYKIVKKSLKASAIGERFNFQILNVNTGERPRVKKIKIHAIALEEA